MAYNPKELRRWRAIIDSHYEGEIDTFADARTIRIQLDQCEAWQREQDKMIDALKDHPEEREKWIADLLDDQLFVTNLKVELEAWLAKRGLTR